MRRSSLLVPLLFALGCPGASAPVARPSPPVLATPHHFEIRFADLPPPFASRDADNPSDVVPPESGDRLSLPPGFAADTYAEGGFDAPRGMALAPNGDVFLTDSGAGTLLVLRGMDEHGASQQRFTFATGLKKPFGIAFAGGHVYVGDTNAVVRFAYQPGQTEAAGPMETVAPLPGRGYREHWTRNLLLSPDGQKLFVTIGSTSNVDVETDPERASILEMKLDGSERRIYASGLRNPVGIALYPGTPQVWVAVEERDRLGDDLVPDYLAAVKDGAFYGWPFAYLGPHPDPRRAGERPDLVARSVPPDLLFAAHSAVLGLVFYQGAMFPAEYKGDAIVAMHGSWNRARRTGYKLARVRFKDGRPAGGYDDFVTGWMRDPDVRQVWGRPVGLLVLGDGSLLVTDDGAKKVWRVTWSGV